MVLRHVFPVTYQGYRRNEGRSIRMYHTSFSSICTEILNCRFGTLIQLGVPITFCMGIYPPANDVCQDAAFLFKDRPELIRLVYGVAWETSLVKVWVLTSFGFWQIDLRLA